MEKLAIFDIDYTITKRETLLELYMFMIKKNPKFITYAPRNIISTLLFALRLKDAGKSKETFIRFIDGIKEDEMQEIVKDFYEKRLCNILYQDAIDMMKKLKKEGCKIYLISASAEFYINEFYKIKEVDKVIGTKFKVENSIHRPIIDGVNCKGEEKVKRLMEEIEKEGIEVDFKNSYMFSDSLSDLPLLNLVGNGYLINYKRKHDKLQILKWK
ncbi:MULTISPECIES: HAD-IB family hydrolase [Clostridium]|uniref:HAD-IB family hydrolase n=1 Tax=Clostridium senegalense TaxID=1465809 RepID=A0A6M0GY97_9CLOT|nr:MULTISPECIES: HAD-IB family hydrolase [Clostridium]NEU03470.1 HAD-IB family hydrolase [Clostridium senegalense]